MCITRHLHAENSVKGATLLKVITGLLSVLVSDISDLAWKHKEATERLCSCVMWGNAPQCSVCPLVEGKKNEKGEKKKKDSVNNKSQERAGYFYYDSSPLLHVTLAMQLKPQNAFELEQWPPFLPSFLFFFSSPSSLPSLLFFSFLSSFLPFFHLLTKLNFFPSKNQEAYLPGLWLHIPLLGR